MNVAEREPKITLSAKQRAVKRMDLYRKQGGLCAECGRWMSLEPDRMDTCTLDHIIPEPMGCKKRDNDDNLRDVCWKCNAEKGSKRL